MKRSQKQPKRLRDRDNRPVGKYAAKLAKERVRLDPETLREKLSEKFKVKGNEP